jgi:hypothetical protein
MTPARHPQAAQPPSQQNMSAVRRQQPSEHPAVRSQHDLPSVSRPQPRVQAGQPSIPEHPAMRSQQNMAPARRPQAGQPPSQQNMPPVRRPEHPSERSRQEMAPVRRTPPADTAVNLPPAEPAGKPLVARSRRASAYTPAEHQPGPQQAPPPPAAPITHPAPGWTDSEASRHGGAHDIGVEPARHAQPESSGGGRRRRADGDPAWHEAVARREEPLPEPPSTGSHGRARTEGRSVQDLLAAHGGEQAGGRRRRRRDDD